jgi:hypothetical protein
MQAARRATDITRIHVLRSKLQLSDDEYRDLMSTLYDGRRSSTALTPGQQAHFVAHLQKLVDDRQRGVAPAKPRAPLSPRLRKGFSLWQQLADANLVRDRRMSALRAFVTRQTGVQMLEWLTKAQEDAVVEALKKWLSRGHAPGSEMEAGHG